jgi:integrase/recombinase XerD
MNEAFWNGLFDTRWEDAPLGPEAIRLARHLRSLGYTERTYRTYAQMVVHLGRVLDLDDRADLKHVTAPVVQDFVDHHLPHCSCYRQPAGHVFAWAPRAFATFFSMLQAEGVVNPRPTAEVPYQEVLRGYEGYLVRTRGLAETTVTNYRRYVRDFLTSRGQAVTIPELVRLTSTDLLAFSRQRGAALGTTAWNHLALALSALFRWLELEGHGGRHLIGAVPLRRKYSLADVPCALPPEQVRSLLGAADLRRPTGRRNYAMLLLIATYGLRGCEVRVLRLDDLDWSSDELTIFSPKTGRRRRMPLTRAVGEAVLEYLRRDRPASPQRTLFLSHVAPHRPLKTKLSKWVKSCFERAGIKAARGGAHVLRHSLAVELLRQGESLKSIGDVLGHRSPETTFIYTKVDIDDLRSVALEPEVVS